MIDRLLAPLHKSDPRVSLLIINHNYEGFVRDAIVSVKEQDYKNFECFVVDNASEDGSAAIIKKTIKGDPRFQGIFFEENLNQMGACKRSCLGSAGSWSPSSTRTISCSGNTCQAMCNCMRPSTASV